MKSNIRDIPYPYSSMLAICSDLDETPSGYNYFEISSFLNSDLMTEFGSGLNIEVGNTIYFYMPYNQFSYFNSSSEDRVKIRNLIRSGHIDCIHSFGDLVSNREDVKEIISHLREHDCRLKVWVDHAVADTNLDSTIMNGTGANQHASAYHADITFDYGIKYVWKGRVTSIIGQNVARTYSGIFSIKNPLKSIITLLKELMKVILARLGNKKYYLHKRNNLMEKTYLNDGREVNEFIRCNPHCEGVSSNDDANGFSKILTEKFMINLVGKRASSILYTHLGKEYSRDEPFSKDTIESFKTLKRYYDNKQILVATTNRLLDFEYMKNNIKIVKMREDKSVNINIVFSDDSIVLDGLTIYIDKNEYESDVNLYANNIPVSYMFNNEDYTGRRSISILWRKLSYPVI